MLGAPYNITHLYLENEQEFNLSWSHNDGQYLVLWWRCIAIGDLFLNPGEELNDQILRKKILKAIEPAVDLYESGKPPVINFKRAFLENNHQEFSAGMNEIFSNFIPHIIPPTADMSVVICTHNSNGYLKKCLESFGGLKCMPLEIIVVDSAPVDDSNYFVVKEFESIIYIKEKRRGIAVARNAGVRAAKGKIVAFVDDNTQLHPWWIFQVNETFAKTDASAMTGLIIPSDLSTESQQILERYWSFSRDFTDKMFDPYFLIDNLSDGPPVWKIGSGTNMAFRKTAFDKAGYFDERIDAGTCGSSADLELWYRVLLKGGSIDYNPRAIVFREHRKDVQSLKQKMFSYMQGFASATLIQQSQNSNAGYKKQLYLKMPVYYFKLILRGFPYYRSRYSTVFHELKGFLSGIRHYHYNKKRARF
jgi:glycosyltransferase involved in cell wall biosynthesis